MRDQQTASPKRASAPLISYGGFGAGLAAFFLYVWAVSASGALSGFSLAAGGAVVLAGLFAGLSGAFALPAKPGPAAMLHMVAGVVLLGALLLLALFTGAPGGVGLIALILLGLSAAAFLAVGILCAAMRKPAVKAAATSPASSDRVARLNTQTWLGVAAMLLIVGVGTGACITLHRADIARRQRAKEEFQQVVAAMQYPEAASPTEPPKQGQALPAADREATP